MLFLTRTVGATDGRADVVILVPGLGKIVIRSLRSNGPYQARMGITAPPACVIMRGEHLTEHDDGLTLSNV